MQTDDLANALLRSAAGLSRWASRHADLEIPWAQARVLSLLEELGPARVTTLAAADDTSQPTMTTQVQRLEAEGWATRTTDPVDGRASLVSLTAAGHEALAGARRARAAALRPVLEGLDPERLRAATSLLSELVEATRSAAGHEPARTTS
ncbi:MAG: winged helix-turn-helix transcriptional regulator [Micrococcales bacterium]|uniref:MarR family winged helix-turn-helix transcriptional regulator n=1 Tax=Phycicoccus sp. TaxID=1902410 RepID=UPI001983F074|nr:MarR family winged helix-turn-helix transcriptional regulator [Phycicoccus sp.]MBD3784640.1 winged helix-turn-helix transcriptional regulator [Micrococcales bacterium]HMM96454.1 MarR family winged helix-turn-helix transcriptional regulator [Phycicoccus sp.]